MANEIELKFIASSRTLDKVMHIAWLKPMMRGELQTRRLHSVYFDTRDRKLRNNGFALRVRSDGTGHVQTVKTASPDGVGFERGEWETPVARMRPDWKRLHKTDARLPPKSLAKHTLRQVFETKVVRTTVTLHAGRSTIELALDKGFIVAAGRREPIHEIELELKKGRKSDLCELGTRLAAALSLEYGFWAKAERGYALHAREKDVVAMAESIALDPAMPGERALRQIGFSCLRQIAGNRGAVLRRDSEGLHQMRIGLRRLKVAIGILSQQGDGTATKRLEREVKWLIGELTPARDFDVFLHEYLLPRYKTNPRHLSLRQLKATALARRRSEFSKLARIIEGERYRKLMLDAALWLIRQEITSHTAGSLRRQSRAGFRHLDRHIRNDLAKLKRLDARQRHKLRIQVKTFRYAIEFFPSVYSDRRHRVRNFEKALKRLQGCLGELNDIAVHRRLVNSLLQKKGWRRPGEAFELGFICGSERVRSRELLVAATRMGDDYLRCRRFWR